MSNFQNNLIALQQINPDLSIILKEIFPRTVSIRSRFNPNQFQTQIHHLSQEHMKQFVLIGAGSGRVIHRIIDGLNPLYLVVIEPNADQLAAVFHQHDFSKRIQEQKIIFGLGTTIQSLAAGLLPVKTSLAAHGYQVLVNPEVYDDQSTETQAIVHNIQMIVEQESLFLRMRLARANLCQMNLILNLPAMLQSISLDSVSERYNGMAALIVAAGPSLDESVEEIKQVQERFVIIAVDTAVRTLLYHGIHPHLVVTTDPTKDNARHFDGVELHPNTVFAFTPDCQASNIQMHQSHPHKLCLFDDSTHLSDWMQKHLGFTTILKRPLNVSEAAVRLAVHLGFDTIVFTGLDLAIPLTGGKTHSSEASHAFTITENTLGKIKIQKHDGSEEWLPVVEVDGWNDESVFTYPSFQMYLRELESIIKETPLHWIDCTQYGAKKQGCQRMNLYDAASQFGQPVEHVDRMVSLIHTCQYFASELCVQELKNGLGILETYQSKLQRIMRCEFEWKEGEDIWIDFLHDATVKALLDHVVFRFQFTEPLNRIEPSKRHAVIQQNAKDAHQVFSLFIPILHDVIQSLHTDA
jgi:hypothetical protein